ECTLEVTSKGSWVNGSAHYFNIYITVNTTAESAIVTLNLQKDPFPGWNVGSVISSTNWIPVPGYDCSGEMPTLRLYPNPNNGGVAQQMFLELSERSTDNPNAICNS